MATVNKDFRVKHGLVVEGTNATVDGSDIITEDAIVGGTQTNITVTYDAVNKVVNFAAESGLADGDTDDLAEGTTNLYYTEARAKTDAAELLTGATLTNITITGDGDGLTITAENGVADSDTDDLTEGTTNLYYTDSRARQAVSAGDGIDYSANTGVISANVGYGLELSDGQIVVDSIIATNTSVGDAITDHSDLTTGVHGVTGDVVGTTDIQELTNKTLGEDVLLSADLDASENKIVNLATPTDAFDAATKAYVDAKAEGLSVKPAVMAATTANLASTYDNGTLGVGSTLTSTSNGAFPLIDGVQLSTLSGQRGLLVKNQTDATQNGRYNLTTLGDENTPWVLTRCGLCDDVNEIPSAYVFVQGGDLYEATGWAAFVENPTTFVVGDDDISWFQFAGAGTYLAGNGLDLDGNTFSIDDTVTATKDYVDTNFVNVADLPGELDDYVLITQKGAADGVATLDEDGQVPVTQLAHVTEAIDGLSTDDIEEGTTNLYFTDARAVTALESVIPNFDAVNLVGFGGTQIISRQVASKWTNVSNPDTPTESFLKTEYRSAKYLVKIASGTHTELSEVLLTLDTSDNIAITEYAVVGTNGSLATISADVSPSDKVRLLITPANANSTVTITGTWLA
jgi:hypothetical protein